ncbi:receptor like protein kinase S.2-like [Hordeum vulgare subsp. vulgare]|uniref:receptor like protein kinase S.2-like n=1 Tax=Hordeum vulgare subsp. vulgare TaxID=112509 RepID=UPI001D1A352C|nr:receptor like protein kinase S.2-like [Hordeum vulgare subsp. vulgare]
MDQPELEVSEIDELERIVGDAGAKARRLKLSLLEHITNGFSNKSEIDRGGFAVVYLGVLPSGLHIAVKKFYSMPGWDESAFENEISIIMKVAHENIVRLIGYCDHTNHEQMEYNGELVLAEYRQRFICTEYIPNGILATHITDEFHPRLDWDQHYQILKGICRGLFHLHHKVHIFHGDIKPGNILIGDNFVPKIYDFGLSRSLCEGEPLNYDEFVYIHLCRAYMPPEMLEYGRWSTKSDIYALGVTITELLTGKRRWHRGLTVERELKELRKRLVRKGVFLSWENKYHQVRTCLEIAHTCMENDPEKRPTALDIIQSLDRTESVNCSAQLLWQSGDEESDTSDTEALETETTTEILEENPDSPDMTGETCTQEPDKSELVIELPASVDLSDLKVLEKITDDFSHERIVGKDGTFKGFQHKAFVYKGDIPRGEIIAVKRLIGVEIPVEKFKREAHEFTRLDHMNIVKVAGYCHDQSRRHKLVHFKGEPLPQLIKGAEQLLCYEYMHNGSLHDYLIGHGSRQIDWEMRYKLIKGTCAGLHYLHKGRENCPIFHLNLSPSNVLLDENYIPRITGFDFSKLIGEKNTKSVVLKLNGPIAYLPPDFFHSKGTDLKYLATVDIYSLGLIILEIATQQEIKGNHGVLIKSIEENWREDSQITRLYTSLEADELRQVKMCIHIGLRCVQSKPEKRPTAEDIKLWLKEGIKEGGGVVSRPTVPVPRTGPGGVPRSPVPTNITHADDRIQGNEKPAGFMRRFFRRK